MAEKNERLVGEREGLSPEELGTGRDDHPSVWLRVDLVSCILDRSGKNNVWLTGMVGSVPCTRNSRLVPGGLSCPSWH